MDADRAKKGGSTVELSRKLVKNRSKVQKWASMIIKSQNGFSLNYLRFQTG